MQAVAVVDPPGHVITKLQILKLCKKKAIH